MKPEPFEVTHALELIRKQSRLTPGELRLLTYLVEQQLAGREHEFSQKTIAADVFGRDLRDFEPRSDSIVRTTAANLREGLAKYYQGPGRTDPVAIELAKGTYTPHYSRRQQITPEATSRLWSARIALETRTVSGMNNAILLLDAVLEEAPQLPLALALKSEALSSKAIHGSRPRPHLELARILASKALDHGATVWQAWVANAIVYQAADWNWEAAERCYAQALDLSRKDSGTHVWYTAYLVGRGRPQEGVAHLQRSVENFGYCNPTWLGDLGMLQILSRQYDAAQSTINSALTVAPGYYQHYMHHAILLEALDNPAGALAVIDAMPLRLYERPVTWGLRALFAGLSGATAIARRRLSWMNGLRHLGVYVPATQVALCWLGMGELERAVDELERGCEERDPQVVWLQALPFCRHLAGVRRFQKLIDQIGLVRF